MYASRCVAAEVFPRHLLALCDHDFQIMVASLLGAILQMYISSLGFTYPQKSTSLALYLNPLPRRTRRLIKANFQSPFQMTH